jgi:hypothetical protein
MFYISLKYIHLQYVSTSLGLLQVILFFMESIALVLYNTETKYTTTYLRVRVTMFAVR